MDTSEQFIKMCDCPEIQDNWNPEGLDFTHRRAGRQYKHGTMLWLPRQDQLQEMVGNNWVQNMVGCYDFAFQLSAGACAPCINEKLLESWQSGGDFYKECLNNLSTKYKSMEQLWLAFVMKEKFNKTWDGEKWANL